LTHEGEQTYARGGATGDTPAKHSRAPRRQLVAAQKALRNGERA
jgi:hypothetical protein